MSKRLDFLRGYAERVLGRSLSDAEAAVITDGMTRMDVRRALASLPEKKTSSKKSSWKKAKDEDLTVDEVIEVVVNEVEGGSGEGSE